MSAAARACLRLALLLLPAGLPLLPGTLLALDPSRALTQLVHDVWQSDRGLPHNTVLAIVPARDGYLWLGTAEGLARFDGVRFEVFDRGNTPAIGNNIIWALAEGPDGTLWIGTYGGGVVKYAQGRFQAFTKEQGLADNVVLSVTADRQGDVWIGTAGGLSRLRGSEVVSLAGAAGLGSRPVNALLADRHGTLWVGTDAGLYRSRADGFERFSRNGRLATERIESLGEDRAGHLWVGTTALHRIGDEGTAEFGERDGIPRRPIGGLREDPEGSLWVATRGSGVCRFRDGRATCLNTKDGLSDSTVWSLAGDAEGSLWIGTDVGGLNRLRDAKFAAWGVPEGLSADVVMALAEDRDGALWVGTNGGGLNRWKDGRFSAYHREQGLASETVWAFCERREGSLWIGTNGGGLGVLSNGRLRPFGHETETGRIVAALHEDRKGDLWIGGAEGLTRLSGGSLRRFTTRDGLSQNNVTVIEETRDGALWVGTWDGLNRVEDGRITTFSAREGLSHPAVMTLYEDADGALWVGTYGGGLNRFRDGKFRAVTRREGLFDDVVYRILEDEAGTFWMSSNKGLFTAARSALNDLLDGKIPSVASAAYGRADGLRTVEFNGGTQSAGVRTRRGHLLFPSARGFVEVDPRMIPTNRRIPPVRVEGAAADGRFHDLEAISGNPEILSGARRFSFRFTALSFLAPERVRFEYRLTGFDPAWQEAAAAREASYTNLPPGRYRFEVVACNNDGVWNRNPAVLSFSLRPRFHETWTFRVLVALAVALAGALVFRLRVRQLARRQVELEDLVELRTASLREVTRKLEEANQRLQEQAMRDGLTGLVNRRGWDRALAGEWRRLERTGGVLSVVMFDLDFFKSYNDALGHLAGDDCLQRVAEVLAGNASRPGDVAARFGGEEFALLLPDTPPNGARALAEKARTEVVALGLAHPGGADGGTVTVSAG
ncbi:MAG TPA: two-component regulator propeller domain-containing protein, partial [Thermoanaerobaculia bacterium]|nr:two-component regulator propeller domain-containing protein [Thermoanaerobaculia bacterium]